jgi:hypothetical protein
LKGRPQRPHRAAATIERRVLAQPRRATQFVRRIIAETCDLHRFERIDLNDQMAPSPAPSNQNLMQKDERAIVSRLTRALTQGAAKVEARQLLNAGKMQRCRSRKARRVIQMGGRKASHISSRALSERSSNETAPRSSRRLLRPQRTATSTRVVCFLDFCCRGLEWC